MKAYAARERVEAGVLTASYLPGGLQVADIGTKPLSGHRIRCLLGLVNVKVLEEEDVSSLAAKSLGRMGAVSRAEAAVSPSAAALAGVALACAPRAAAQPFEDFNTRLSMLDWVLGLLGVMVLSILLDLRRVQGEGLQGEGVH